MTANLAALRVLAEAALASGSPKTAETAEYKAAVWNPATIIALLDRLADMTRAQEITVAALERAGWESARKSDRLAELERENMDAIWMMGRERRNLVTALEESAKDGGSLAQRELSKHYEQEMLRQQLRAETAEAALAAAEAACRNHHLEACESCAVTASDLIAAEARAKNALLLRNEVIEQDKQVFAQLAQARAVLSTLEDALLECHAQKHGGMFSRCTQGTCDEARAALAGGE